MENPKYPDDATNIDTKRNKIKVQTIFNNFLILRKIPKKKFLDK